MLPISYIWVFKQISDKINSTQIDDFFVVDA